MQVAEVQAILQSELDARQRPRDLARDEGIATDRGFVIEKYPVAGEHAIGLPVIHGNPVGVQLRGAVGRARVEGRGFLLRDFLDLAIEFRSRGLIEPRLGAHTQDANGFENPQGAERVGVRCVFGLLEGHCDMALRGEVIDLVRLRFLYYMYQGARIRQVSVMQNEIAIGYMRILIEMVDPVGIEQRGTALDAMDDVAFAQQKLREVGAVLAGDTGDQCNFGHHSETGIRSVYSGGSLRDRSSGDCPLAGHACTPGKRVVMGVDFKRFDYARKEMRAVSSRTIKVYA